VAGGKNCKSKRFMRGGGRRRGNKGGKLYRSRPGLNLNSSGGGGRKVKFRAEGRQTLYPSSGKIVETEDREEEGSTKSRTQQSSKGKREKRGAVVEPSKIRQCSASQSLRGGEK